MDLLTLNRWRIFLIVFLIWAAIYLPSLGKTEFKGEEGRRVLPALTMLETGNWMVPSVGGEDYWNKPPGINWLVAISFMLTGEQSEFAARLPSALFVLAFVSLLVWAPLPWLKPPAFLISAIVFLTNSSLIEKGRLIEIEAVYISLTGIAILLWLSAWSNNSSRWSLWILPSIVLGFGILVKGPLIIGFFYGTVIAVLIYARRLKELFTLQHILAVTIIVAMPLAWFYFAYQLTSGPDMVARMTSQFVGHTVSPKMSFIHWVWNVVKSLRNFLPWLLFVPMLWQKMLISRIDQEYTTLFKGCRLGLIISFGSIILMPSMLSRYSLPVIPLVSILIGWILSLHKEFVYSDRLWRGALLAVFCLSCLTAVAGLIIVTTQPLALVVSALAILSTVIIFCKRTLIDNAVVLSLTTALLTVVIMLQYAIFAVPIIKDHERRRPAAYAVNEIVPAGETVYVFKPGYQAFLFYLRPPIKYVLTADEVDKNVRYLLLENRYLEELKTNPQISCRSVEILHRFTDRIKGDYKLVRLE